MAVTEVQPQASRSPGRERTGILTLAALVIGGVGFYVGARNFGTDRRATANLLPYQTLAASLPAADQTMYLRIRSSLPRLESDRAATSRWPEPLVLAADGIAPFSSGDADHLEWQRIQRGATVNYLAIPDDPSKPAWMLAIQEPEPNTPPDPAPNDEEHHRLPDGTTLHLYVWTHRLGGRVPAAFTAQPQNEGWTEVFGSPPNPILTKR